MTNEFSFINLAASTLELRPLPSVRVSESEKIEAALGERSSELIILEPSVFEPEYDDFLKAAKLSLALNDWMDEHNEDELLESYNIAPGELHTKRNLADWIMYSTEELCQAAWIQRNN
jgi:replicative superfamily II helicase